MVLDGIWNAREAIVGAGDSSLARNR